MGTPMHGPVRCAICLAKHWRWDPCPSHSTPVTIAIAARALVGGDREWMIEDYGCPFCDGWTRKSPVHSPDCAAMVLTLEVLGPENGR